MTWTRKRWFVVATLIFLGQVGAIFALHTRQPLRVHLPLLRATRPIAPSTNHEFLELEALNDPMVFAGAHSEGFSAAAWLERARMEFVISNAPPPPAFLPFRRMGALDMASNAFAGPATGLPLFQFTLAKEASPESRLIVEGPLADRPLLTSPTIPVQFGSDVLSNSVVQLSVQGDGFPLLARLISGSGSRAADLTALEIANRARFAPKPSRGAEQDESLEWGRLVFEWFTTGLSATNAPAGQAK